jgi:DNA-binding CsgD family transcriptional regulator
MQIPQAGDELFVGRTNDGNITEVFRRSPEGNVADITRDVERVDANNESFTVYGKRVHPPVEPWRVTCDRDVEATDTMLRGHVRAVVAHWHTQCRDRIALNMERYGLSPRERDVVWALFSVSGTQEIAERLYMEPSTVKNHITSIGQRLGVMGRHAVVLRLLDIEGMSGA